MEQAHGKDGPAPGLGPKRSLCVYANVCFQWASVDPIDELIGPPNSQQAQQVISYDFAWQPESVTAGVLDENGNIINPSISSGGSWQLVGETFGQTNPSLAANNAAQAIESIFSRSVIEMVNMGVRRTGSGTLNGVLNNLQSWYKGCWGCGDQANYLTLQLQATGPSDWQYITQGVDPVLGVYTHYITVALPDYPGNPVIFMDPWRNEITVVGPP